MAWQDPFETFIGATGEIYTADVGRALPAAFATPDPAVWGGLGYASEDGVAVSYAQEIEEFRAWQSANPIRRAKTAETFQVGVSLLQWNEETVPLALGGGAIAAISGGHQYTPPGPQEVIEERAMIVDVFDGDRQMRILIPRGNTAETAEGTFARGALAELPVTFQALQPDSGSLFYIRFSDAAAFAAGS